MTSIADDIQALSKQRSDSWWTRYWLALMVAMLFGISWKLSDVIRKLGEIAEALKVQP